MKNRLIVVLGMHRSGTSAITRGLQVLGVNLGENLYGPLPGVNDKGFWEDVEFNNLNVEILKSLGHDWHVLQSIGAKDVEILRSKKYFPRAEELVWRKVGSEAVVGVKDPRMTKLLPFWSQVFENCQIDVSYLLAVRNPVSVARSLSRRDAFDSERSYILWLGHVVNMLSGSEGNRRALIDFDLLLQRPEEQLIRIADELNLSVDSDALKSYTVDFLDERLRHSVNDLNDLSLAKSCPSVVFEVYSKLLDVASGRNQINNLDFIGLVKRWRNYLDNANFWLKLLDKIYIEKDAMEKVASESGAKLRSFEGNIQALEFELSSAKRNLAERENKIRIFERAITEHDSQVEDLRIDISNILESKSWQIAYPLRRGLDAINAFKEKIAFFSHLLHVGGGPFQTVKLTMRVLSTEGITGIKWRISNLRKIRRTPVSSIGTEREESDSVESIFQIIPYYTDPLLDVGPVLHPPKATIAVHLHLFYSEMLEEFISRIRTMPSAFDLYVSIPDACEVEPLLKVLTVSLPSAGKIIVEKVPNRGRNISPMIIQFGKRLLEYQIIGHFHTKKSPHRESLDSWCENILDMLIGPTNSSGGRVASVINMLLNGAKIVYPEGQSRIIKDKTGWSENWELANRLLRKYTRISIGKFPVVEFVEGSMFWARSDCMSEFLNLPLKWTDFPSEPIDADGTLAHALERLILIFCHHYDGHYIRVHKGDSIADFRQYEEQADYSSLILDKNIKILAYYLPQFHPTPENDLWHGVGFTEWTKVRAANPLFKGHYQQHIPHQAMGYYNLGSPETLKLQAEMMRQAGVHGQIFYHYWFTGKLILERPAQMLLENSNIDMSYCFCWANENWTRRWDGNENEVLLAQEYSPEDARAFIRYLIPFFQDPRYITVEGRPALFVYRPASIPDARQYLRIWEQECLAHGINRPYVVAVLTRGATNPTDFGMDAGVERVLHDWTAGVVPEINSSLNFYNSFEGSVLPYEEVEKFYSSQTERKSFTYFRSLVPIWDNAARYGSAAYLLHGSSPQLFQQWLENVVRYTKTYLPEDRRFVVVNAWNEWAEGAHLEPDSRYGYSYLNCIGRALSGKAYATNFSQSRAIPTGLHIHILVEEYALRQLNSDSYLRRRFLRSLSQSSLFEKCLVSIAAPDLYREISKRVLMIQNCDVKPDFYLQFKVPVIFNDQVIEKMLQSALYSSGSVILSNAYGDDVGLTDVSVNGAVHSSAGHSAPILLIPAEIMSTGYKNFKMRPDARSFIMLSNRKEIGSLPVVTTIIRFHRSADMAILENALYCLSAMQDCIVLPFIAAQDLEEDQTNMLSDMIKKLEWMDGLEPQVHHFRSSSGSEDLRAKMLNESLKLVKTRYAAFLDYDDLLMPIAYSYLINRLEQTGKAISFARVYSTEYENETGTLRKRTRVYNYGTSYNDFFAHNHAPLHSFMLDMTKIDLRDIVYNNGQRFLEDYYLTLQIFTSKNADWASLSEDFYIGDYIHSVDRSHTLAFAAESERRNIFSNEEYQMCEHWIGDLQKRLILERQSASKH